jgi:hypothetical protein
MWRIFAFLLTLLLSVPTTGSAEQRVTLGFGRLFVNDLIGDGEDRWRTGSYTVSWVRGPVWDGTLPGRAGTLLEFRFRGEILAPSNLSKSNPNDRRYAGSLSAGLHTHFALGAAEVAAGADLVFTGPQTGLGRFQSNFHDIFGLVEPQVLEEQIPNGVHPTVLVEVGRSFRMGETVTLRPFAEAQAGVETFVRVGGDLSIGGQWQGGLLIRDVSTGQRYVGIAGQQPLGVSFSLGGDVARVFDSVYLPSDGVPELSDTRSRLRAGLHWQGDTADVFYGVTWLGKEFEQQTEDQVVGSLRVNLRF